MSIERVSREGVETRWLLVMAERADISREQNEGPRLYGCSTHGYWRPRWGSWYRRRPESAVRDGSVGKPGEANLEDAEAQVVHLGDSDIRQMTKRDPRQNPNPCQAGPAYLIRTKALMTTIISSTDTHVDLVKAPSYRTVAVILVNETPSFSARIRDIDEHLISTMYRKTFNNHLIIIAPYFNLSGRSATSAAQRPSY